MFIMFMIFVLPKLSKYAHIWVESQNKNGTCTYLVPMSKATLRAHASKHCDGRCRLNKPEETQMQSFSTLQAKRQRVEDSKFKVVLI